MQQEQNKIKQQNKTNAAQHKLNKYYHSTVCNYNANNLANFYELTTAYIMTQQ